MLAHVLAGQLVLQQGFAVLVKVQQQQQDHQPLVVHGGNARIGRCRAKELDGNVKRPGLPCRCAGRLPDGRNDVMLAMLLRDGQCTRLQNIVAVKKTLSFQGQHIIHRIIVITYYYYFF